MEMDACFLTSIAMIIAAIIRLRNKIKTLIIFIVNIVSGLEWLFRLDLFI